MIALLDYGAGNLTSVRKAFRAVGAEPSVVFSGDELDDAAGIVVPGVGNFAATGTIDERTRETIARRVEAGVPLFGICVGMQLLFEGSTEAPGVPGLGLMKGRCAKLEVERPLKVPHVGWNALSIRRASSLLDGLIDGTQVYFTHSFAAPVTDDCAAAAFHGTAFAAAVERDNVFGVQFHPEKSSDAGLHILRNFVRVTRS